jgi:hypothetical protein
MRPQQGIRVKATLQFVARLLGTVGALGGVHVPAQTVTRDRFDYASACATPEGAIP